MEADKGDAKVGVNFREAEVKEGEAATPGLVPQATAAQATAVIEKERREKKKEELSMRIAAVAGELRGLVKEADPNQKLPRELDSSKRQLRKPEVAAVTGSGPAAQKIRRRRLELVRHSTTEGRGLPGGRGGRKHR